MLNKILSYFAFLFIRVMSMTYRYEFLNKEVKEKLSSNSQNYVYAVWHNNIIGTILSHIGGCHIVIVSASKDGDVIAKILTLLGNKVARGSSSRGGVRALSEMIKIMKNKELPGAISVDGPRGPLYKAKKGVIEVAKETGAVIVPLASYPSSYWVFEKAWDKFRLPKPFSKITLQLGEPIKVEKDISPKQFSEIAELLERNLNENEQKIREKLNGDPR